MSTARRASALSKCIDQRQQAPRQPARLHAGEVLMGVVHEWTAVAQAQRDRQRQQVDVVHDEHICPGELASMLYANPQRIPSPGSATSADPRRAEPAREKGAPAVCRPAAAAAREVAVRRRSQATMVVLIPGVRQKLDLVLNPPVRTVMVVEQPSRPDHHAARSSETVRLRARRGSGETALDHRHLRSLSYLGSGHARALAAEQ